MRRAAVMAAWGHVAEWLRSGLQNRLHQFNSGRGLHKNLFGEGIVLTISR
jgi:hypothetical protein